MMKHISNEAAATSRCARCRTPLTPEDTYTLPRVQLSLLENNRIGNNQEEPTTQHRLMCETGAMEVRIHRGRKTHWQYLTSIKGDYLRPGKADPL